MRVEGGVAINEQLWFSHTFTVIGRDFRGWADSTPMTEDWERWLSDELQSSGCRVVPEGAWLVGLATTRHEYASGLTVEVGQPIVKLGTATADEIAALLRAEGKADPVLRTHPWKRLGPCLGHVSLERLEDTPEATRYGQLLNERCWGQMFLPFAAGPVELLEPRTHPLSDLLRERDGFQVRDLAEAQLVPVWNAHDAERFFAPLLPDLDRRLTSLGIGTRARAVSHDDGYGFVPTPLRLGPRDPIVDLAGTVIPEPEPILAAASLELWHLRLGVYDRYCAMW